MCYTAPKGQKFFNFEFWLRTGISNDTWRNHAVSQSGDISVGVVDAWLTVRPALQLVLVATNNLIC